MLQLCHMKCVVEEEEAPLHPPRSRHGAQFMFSAPWQVIFLYQLAPGVCLDSRGLHVAQMAGLPETVISRAAAQGRAMLRVQSVSGVCRALAAGDAVALGTLQAQWKAATGGGEAS